MLKVDDILDNKYRIVRLIGEGGMGAVFEGRHTGTGRRVAVKVIRSDPNAEGTEVLAQRFLREARTAGAIESQYIAQVFDAGRDAATGFPYLVLEFLSGQDLQELLRRLGPLPVDLALRIFAHACTGLARAHAAKVVHRDVKPANIFLSNREDGEIICKMLDFGVAKFTTDRAENDAELDVIEAAGITQTGALVGSPLYMAPEQARGRRDIDQRADIWALGILLHKMLTGKTPHERAGLGIGELIMAICLQEPAPIRQMAPWVPVEIETLLNSILRIERDDRPSSVEMILAELRVLLPAGWSIDKTMLVAREGDGHNRISLPPPSLNPSNPPLGRLLNSPGPTPANTAETLASEPVAAHTKPEVGAQSTLNPPIQASTPGTLPNPGSASNPRPRYGSILAAVIAAMALFGGGMITYSRLIDHPDDSAPSSSVAMNANANAPASASAEANVAPAKSAESARRTDCPAGMQLVPGGKFVMGSDEPALDLSHPAHSAIIDTFCIDINEVTSAEYRACADAGECKRPAETPNWPKAVGVAEKIHESKRTAYAELCNYGNPERAQHPINCLSWFLAHDYCAYHKKRLPTEAEWEFVARGTDDRKSPWGEVMDPSERVNAGGVEFTRWETKHVLIPSSRLYEIDDGFEGTAPVGSFPKGKTKHGVNDLVGNVWEWTADWFEPYGSEEVINPKGPASGERKSIRGGSFEGGMRQWINPAFRAAQSPTATSPTIGFRCVMNL